jgi:hypothetical protein
MKLPFIPLISVILLTSASNAMAWGKVGHEVTGAIAEQLLTTQAKVKLNNLLPAQSLADISTYMDEERMSLKHTIKGSDKWHYNNLPVCGAPPKITCSTGDCASAKIPEYIKILQSSLTSKEDKAFAVKVLVHLVGDIHQPLHTADNNDRGGNLVKVGKGSNNLHSVWDSGILQKMVRKQNPAQIADTVRKNYSGQLSSFATGDSDQWILESYRLSRDIYMDLPVNLCATTTDIPIQLPGDYAERNYPLVQKQLAKAGARIAYVLNTAFK